MTLFLVGVAEVFISAACSWLCVKHLEPRFTVTSVMVWLLILALYLNGVILMVISR